MISERSLTQLRSETSHNNEDNMNDTNLEQALRLFEKPKPPPAMTYQDEQQRIHDNYERLKAERLAREAKPESENSV